MIALLVIFILIFVLSMINIVCQIIKLINCSKGERVTIIRIPADLLSEICNVKKDNEE